MENDSLDASAALGLVRSSRADLADRLVTPWWYHLVLGLLSAGLIVGYSFPRLVVRYGTLAAFLLGTLLLVQAYKRLTGLWVNGFHPGPARRWAVFGGLVLGGADARRPRPARPHRFDRLAGGGRRPRRPAHGPDRAALRPCAARGPARVNAPAFDPVVHAQHRLQVCALLAPVDEAEFAVLRDAVAVSDSVLSKQLRVLEEAGYLVLRKRTAGGRVRTWAALTAQGRQAFAGHVAALQQLVAGPV